MLKLDKNRFELIKVRTISSIRSLLSFLSPFQSKCLPLSFAFSLIVFTSLLVLFHLNFFELFIILTPPPPQPSAITVTTQLPEFKNYLDTGHTLPSSFPSKPPLFSSLSEFLIIPPSLQHRLIHSIHLVCSSLEDYSTGKDSTHPLLDPHSHCTAVNSSSLAHLSLSVFTERFGGVVRLVHHNCHRDLTQIDDDPIVADYVDQRKGPTVVELRLVGPEILVFPLHRIATSFHHCSYEASYFVTLRGDYSVWLFGLYLFDYRWIAKPSSWKYFPRPQNAFLIENMEQFIEATKKEISDQPLLDLIKLSQTIPAILAFPYLPKSSADRNLLSLQHSPPPQGRWVSRSYLRSVGYPYPNETFLRFSSVSSSSVMKPYCAFLADINSYEYIPYSFPSIIQPYAQLHSLRQEIEKRIKVCLELQHSHKVKVGESWGTLPLREIQSWDDNGCNTAIATESYKQFTQELPPQKETQVKFAIRSLKGLDAIESASSHSFSKPTTLKKSTLPVYDHPTDLSSIFRCLRKRRIAFIGDSQTRRLFDRFVTHLSARPYVALKQRLDSKVKPSELRWECSQIDSSQTKICYWPITNYVQFSYDDNPLLPAFSDLIQEKSFDLILLNQGQHWAAGPYERTLSSYSHMIEYGLVNLARGLTLFSNHTEYDNVVPSNQLYQENENGEYDPGWLLLRAKMIHLSSMPFPRSTIDPTLRPDGDGRTVERLEMFNEITRAVMSSYNITQVDSSLGSFSVGRPFVDCSTDSNHLIEPIFDRMFILVFQVIANKLRCLK